MCMHNPVVSKHLATLYIATAVYVNTIILYLFVFQSQVELVMPLKRLHNELDNDVM